MKIRIAILAVCASTLAFATTGAQATGFEKTFLGGDASVGMRKNSKSGNSKNGISVGDYDNDGRADRNAKNGKGGDAKGQRKGITDNDSPRPVDRKGLRFEPVGSSMK